MKLSMWSNFYYEFSFDEALKRIKDGGFSFSELSDSHFISIIEKREFEKLNILKEKIKIETPQVHSPICSIYEDSKKDIIERIVDLADERREIREREINCIIEWIDYCKISGVECIVVHPGGIKGYDDFEEYKRIEKLNIESFKKIAEKCERGKIKIAIENTGRKGLVKKNSPYNRAEELLELIEKIGSKYIGICLDTSHANTAKIDIPQFIKMANGKIYATHISDNLGENDDHLFPFSGKIKWDEVMKSFKEINYNGIFNFEVPGENRCLPEIRDIKIMYALQIGNYLTGGRND